MNCFCVRFDLISFALIIFVLFCFDSDLFYFVL